jgi:hypothetical protein
MPLSASNVTLDMNVSVVMTFRGMSEERTVKADGSTLDGRRPTAEPGIDHAARVGRVSTVARDVGDAAECHRHEG